LALADGAKVAGAKKGGDLVKIVRSIERCVDAEASETRSSSGGLGLAPNVNRSGL
jgi:hypothetical protein